MKALALLLCLTSCSLIDSKQPEIPLNLAVPMELQELHEWCQIRFQNESKAFCRKGGRYYYWKRTRAYESVRGLIWHECNPVALSYEVIQAVCQQHVGQVATYRGCYIIPIKTPLYVEGDMYAAWHECSHKGGMRHD